MDPYKSLREEAYEANMEIPRRSLALYTWGNVSAFDPKRALFAIKPSGVPYEKLRPADMVIVDLEGHKVDGSLNPSSDTKTHIVLYRTFKDIGGITHTHSTYAVAWAQAQLPVPVLGTTHADHCTHPIPCTDYIDREALNRDYEQETGNLIVRPSAHSIWIRRRSPWFLWLVMVPLPGGVLRKNLCITQQCWKKYVRWPL